MSKKLIVCLMLVAVILLGFFLHQDIGLRVELDTALLFITASGALATAIAAFIAILISKKTADTQNDLMRREWLPYLSYEKMHGERDDDSLLNTKVTYRFYVLLKNNGRCAVRYKIEKFNVELILTPIKFILACDEDGDIRTDRKGREERALTLPKTLAEEIQKDRVLAINSELNHSCGVFQIDPRSVEAGYTLSHFRIDFVVGFKDGGAGRGANKEEYPYKLKYKVELVGDNKCNRVFIEDNIVECDIEGY